LINPISPPIIPQPLSFVNTFSNSYFAGNGILYKKSPTKAMGDNLMLGFLISWNLSNTDDLSYFLSIIVAVVYGKFAVIQFWQNL